MKFEDFAKYLVIKTSDGKARPLSEDEINRMNEMAIFIKNGHTIKRIRK